jgi:hypothetical protein
MPVTFKKLPKTPEAPVPQPVVDTDDIPFDTAPVAASPEAEVEIPVNATPVVAQAPVQPAQPVQTPAVGLTPQQAYAAYQTSQQQSASRSNYRPFRFFLKVDESAKITFLDGDLDPTTGFFASNVIHEHTVRQAGNYVNYACLDTHTSGDPQVCPLCNHQEGDRQNRSYLVAFFTVIDHTRRTGKNGKIYENEVRVFAAKTRVMTRLLEFAKEEGTLAGMRFDVRRLKDQANTGEDFTVINRFPVHALCDKYNASIVDYSQATNYASQQELRAMGFGGMPIGAETPGGDIDFDQL